MFQTIPDSAHVTKSRPQQPWDGQQRPQLPMQTRPLKPFAPWQAERALCDIRRHVFETLRNKLTPRTKPTVHGLTQAAPQSLPSHHASSITSGQRRAAVPWAVHASCMHAPSLEKPNASGARAPSLLRAARPVACSMAALGPRGRRWAVPRRP